MVQSYHGGEKYGKSTNFAGNQKARRSVVPVQHLPCAIPQDFTQVALHWQDSMELVFVKKGRGIVQAGLTSYTAAAGDIYVFAPGVLHALRQLDNERMEYENIIFDLELLGGSGDVAAEKYLLPLQTAAWPSSV